MRWKSNCVPWPACRHIGRRESLFFFKFTNIRKKSFLALWGVKEHIGVLDNLVVLFKNFLSLSTSSLSFLLRVELQFTPRRSQSHLCVGWRASSDETDRPPSCGAQSAGCRALVLTAAPLLPSDSEEGLQCERQRWADRHDSPTLHLQVWSPWRWWVGGDPADCPAHLHWGRCEHPVPTAVPDRAPGSDGHIPWTGEDSGGSFHRPCPLCFPFSGWPVEPLGSSHPFWPQAWRPGSPASPAPVDPRLQACPRSVPPNTTYAYICQTLFSPLLSCCINLPLLFNS